MKEKSGGSRDPNQFIPPTVKEGEPKKSFRFFVLPPLSQGDKTADGTSTKSMELFYIPNGNHWVNKKPYPCPRVHDEESCSMCDHGFDLMSETQDKKERSRIAKTFLPQQRNAVNIYFLPDQFNPEELRGKNMWFNAPKGILDIWDACVMRDDAGDPADPQAFGVFMDENSAYVFQLEVGHKGGYNDYSSSKFLASLGKMPIARMKDSSGKVVANSKRIQEILDSRFDIYTKFEPRDHDKIKQLVSDISDQSDGEEGGFDEDEANKKPKVNKPTAPKNKPAPKPVNEEVAIDEPAAIDGEGTIEEPVAPPPAPKTTPKVTGKNQAKVTPPAPVSTPDTTGDISEDELSQLMADVETPAE